MYINWNIKIIHIHRYEGNVQRKVFGVYFGLAGKVTQSLAGDIIEGKKGKEFISIPQYTLERGGESILLVNGRHHNVCIYSVRNVEPCPISAPLWKKHIYLHWTHTLVLRRVITMCSLMMRSETFQSSSFVFG